MRRSKDLQAFAQLNDLASGKPRPQVQWLSLEEKKGAPLADANKPSRFTKSSYFQDTGKKDDRIIETQTDESLRALPQARLRALLAAQQTLANSPACKRLPDKGSKIFKKITQIEAALAFVVEVDALVMGLEVGMSQLKLDEKSDGKRSLEVDDQFREAVARKLQRAQQAKQPFTQTSRAITIVPDGSFPGVAEKYRSGAPKFLPLAEAQQLHHEAQQRALTLLREEGGPSSLVKSASSSFHTAHWHRQPDADFSGEAYRDIISDFDDDINDDDDNDNDFEHSDSEKGEEEEEAEEQEQGEEGEGFFRKNSNSNAKIVTLHARA